MDKRTISIIIPCRNEEAFIGACLDSIIDQDYQKEGLEVFVVDGMSQDGSRRIVERYIDDHPFLVLLNNPDKTIPSAMNIGLAHATGGIIMKVDSHAMYAKDYISKCIKFLNEYGADNVGGTIIPLPRSDTLIGRAIVCALSHPFGVGNSHFRLGCKEPMWADTAFSGCYRREVFARIGRYDENIARSEDVAINAKLRKAGGKILLVPEIISYYYARSKLSDFCRHNFDNGFWVTNPLKFGTALFSWRHMIPLVFVLSLIGSVILWSASGSLESSGSRLFLFLVALYSTCTIYFSASIAVREREPGYVAVLPLVFGLLHIGYGLGSIWGLLMAGVSREFWKTLIYRHHDDFSDRFLIKP